VHGDYSLSITSLIHREQQFNIPFHMLDFKSNWIIRYKYRKVMAPKMNNIFIINFQASIYYLAYKGQVKFCTIITNKPIKQQTDLLTNSMEQSHSSEANSHLTSQKTPHFLWNLKVHYHVNKSLALVPILRQLKFSPQLPTLFLQLHLELGNGLFL
jgi:hypothetical protein